MSLNLRDNQKVACQAVWEALEQGENALLKAPTAMGKSVVVSAICNRFINTVNGRILIIVDREVLVSQLAASISQFYPQLQVGVCCATASSKKDLTKQITVASRQSLVGQLANFEPVNLIIADEAHLLKPHREGRELDQYGIIIERLREYNPKVRLFGCSATPWRLNDGFIYGRVNHPDTIPYWGKLTHSITFKELTSSGFLAPLTGKIKTDGLDLSGVDLIAGEYNIGQLSDAMEHHVDTLLDALEEFASDRKKILIFCVDIKHADAVAEVIPNCVSYHSKLTKKERVEILRRFKIGEIRALSSVATLTTGFDDPGVDCILCARPTMASALFIQIVGRGLRIAEGKEDCLLIDVTNNTTKHLPTNDLDNVFVKIPQKIGKKEGEGDAPIKICEGILPDKTQCLAELHPKVCICPYCGYEFQREIAECLPTMSSVSFDATPLPDPEWINVVGMEITIHESKKTKKLLLKVQIELALDLDKYPYVAEWICTSEYYEHGVVEIGESKWLNFTGCNEIPQNGEDINLCLWTAQEEFRQPTRVFVQKMLNGYFELKDMDFDKIGTYNETPMPAPSLNDDLIPF